MINDLLVIQGNSEITNRLNPFTDDSEETFENTEGKAKIIIIIIHSLPNNKIMDQTELKANVEQIKCC